MIHFLGSDSLAGTNKVKWIAAMAVVVLVGCDKLGLSQFGGEAKLESDEAKASYALGLEAGSRAKQLNLKVDHAAMKQGLEDGQSGKDPRKSREEIMAAIQKLQENGVQKTKEAGEKYLADNKQKAGVKVTASGLQYEVVTEGSGATPVMGDTVRVHYTGTLIDGTKFDSSLDRGEPAEFQLGQIIKGWDEALKLMKVGSKWKLTIPSELAYGERGAGPIPPHSVLLFDVELLEVKKGAGMPPGHGAGDGHDHGHGEAPKGKKSSKASGK